MSEPVTVMVFSHDLGADAAVMRDVLGLDCAAAGGGWLLVTLPSGALQEDSALPDEAHQLYLACRDIEERLSGLRDAGVEAIPASSGHGPAASFTLPGGAMVRLREDRGAF